MGVLNIPLTWPIHTLDEIDINGRREWSKKHALSLSEGSVQQGRSPFAVLTYWEYAPRAKRARTPLAAFFNIPY